MHAMTMQQSDFYPPSGWATIIGAQSDLAIMERLLTRYQRPILLEIQSRIRGNKDDAEELAQEFVKNCLQRDFLKNVHPAKGRFRSFIKKCVVNFLRDVHRKKAAQPQQVSLDETDDEGHHLIEPPGDAPPPEVALDCQWARQVLALSLDSLEQECVAARRGALFIRLKSFLHTDPEGDSYEAVARSLHMKEGAVRTACHRMRQRLGEIIREEIQQTVATEQDVRDELRYFLELLGQNSP